MVAGYRGGSSGGTGRRDRNVVRMGSAANTAAAVNQRRPRRRTTGREGVGCLTPKSVAAADGVAGAMTGGAREGVTVDTAREARRLYAVLVDNIA